MYKVFQLDIQNQEAILRHEVKYKPQGMGFKPTCLVVVAANSNQQTTPVGYNDDDLVIA